MFLAALKRTVQCPVQITAVQQAPQPRGPLRASCGRTRTPEWWNPADAASPAHAEHVSLQEFLLLRTRCLNGGHACRMHGRHTGTAMACRENVQTVATVARRGRPGATCSRVCIHACMPCKLHEWAAHGTWLVDSWIMGPVPVFVAACLLQCSTVEARLHTTNHNLPRLIQLNTDTKSRMSAAKTSACSHSQDPSRSGTVQRSACVPIGSTTDHRMHAETAGAGGSCS